MKVYITYDRYERDEWYNIYYVSTDRNESIRHCVEEDLVDFISYGPDDCHSFQLQEVNMTKRQYEQFTKWIEEDQGLEDYGRESSDLYKFMYNLYDSSGVVGDTSVIISTDGCSDNVDIIRWYCEKNGLDVDDDDIYYEVEDELFNDEELYLKTLKDYLKDTY